MCVVSNMGDMGRKMWPECPPNQPYVWPPATPKPGKWYPLPGQTVPVESKPYNGPTKEQFEEFLDLLRAARKFDKATGQADCAAEEKTGWIKSTVKYLGIDESKLKDIFE